MAITRLKLEDILDAREKLEGIGLIKTYLKKGSVNNYIYELYSPLDPKEFLENPILSVTLESNIGTKEYRKSSQIFFSSQNKSSRIRTDLSSRLLWTPLK